MRDKLYHAGIRGQVSRSTLADANETRDWRIYADFAQVLIGIARKLYAQDKFGVAEPVELQANRALFDGDHAFPAHLFHDVGQVFTDGFARYGHEVSVDHVMFE